MINFKEETVCLAWCDNGQADGKFTEGLVSSVINFAQNSMPISQMIRVQGNQIARQRDVLFNAWEEKKGINSDWLLWVDSDIVLNYESLKLLFETADKKNIPVISGVYFIAKENINTLPTPYPCIFLKAEKDYEVEHIHPLPENQILKIHSAGMGAILMHRSIITKLRSKYKKELSLFAEDNEKIDKFISEDIMFFKKLGECNIDIYAHTSALFQHMKTFPFDINYYLMYWDSEHKIKRKNEYPL